jgi:hypothetical protein
VYHICGSLLNQSRTLAESADICGVIALSDSGRLNVRSRTWSAGKVTWSSPECGGGMSAPELDDMVTFSANRVPECGGNQTENRAGIDCSCSGNQSAENEQRLA